MDPFSFPGLHQSGCITSKCKFSCNPIWHWNIWGVINACRYCRRACATLPRSPHPRPSTWESLLHKSKWVWWYKTKCGRWWPALGNLDTSKPPWIRQALTARTWRGRRGQERIVLPSPWWGNSWIIPVIFGSGSSGCWGAQWRGDWSTYGTSMDIKMVGELGWGWWWAWWKIFQPWDERIGISITLGIGSITWRDWAWEGRWARTWIVRCTWARLVGWAWTCRRRSTHNVHSINRFASLHKSKKSYCCWWLSKQIIQNCLKVC